MIKQLILLFHVFGVFFYQLIFSGDITVNQKVPASIEPGKEVVVEITIHKNDITGFSKIQQMLPLGFSAEAIETKGATFSFKDNKIKFIWMALPSEEEFQISYKLKVDETISGDFTIGGKFSFIDNSERKNIVIPIAKISVNKTTEEEVTEEEVTEEEVTEEEVTEEEVTEEEVTEEEVTEEEVTEEEVIPTPSINSKRTINESSPGNYTVSIKINKQYIDGVVKLVEKIPNGFTASEKASEKGVFSFKDQNVKILWTSAPKADEFEISYNITSESNNESTENKISGLFTYLDNDKTIDYKIQSSSFQLNLPEKEETITETANNSEEISSSEKITSTPSPENGVTYKVQVAASHKIVTSKYFKSKFNLPDNVNTINHEGWVKYLVGSYDQYKQARDKRNLVRNNIKTAFVTAYNAGERITVQEALMISNQKWYK